MKILFINLPYYGHVVPTIGLVQELINNGCEVTYLLPFDWKDKIKDSGATFYGYQNHKQLSEQIKNAYHAARSIISNYDLVIYEQFFFLGKHLADEFNKPVVRIFTAPATNKKLMNAFIQKGPLSIFKNKWICKAFTKDIVKNIEMKTDNWLDEIIYNPPQLNLVYTLKEYQPDIHEFNDEQYKFIGPSIYNRNECFVFHKTRPIIYISLGSVVKGRNSFYRKCFEALKDEYVDVILSTKKKFRNIPSNFHIFSYVPQTEVLKIADLFITHGGMNSVSEALVSNTPMLVIPFASDQFVNADCVEKLNVGKKLESNQLHRLRELSLSIMNDDSMKESLNKTNAMIEKSLGNKGGAKLIIDLYQKEKIHERNND